MNRSRQFNVTLELDLDVAIRCIQPTAQDPQPLPVLIDVASSGDRCVLHFLSHRSRYSGAEDALGQRQLVAAYCRQNGSFGLI